MRHHLFGETAMKIRHYLDTPPKEHLLDNPGDEDAFMEMCMDNLGSFGPRQEKHFLDEEKIEDDFLPVWSRLQLLVPKQEPPDTTDIDVRTEVVRQILADMVGRDGDRMTAFLQCQSLLEDTDMCSSIRKKWRRRNNQNVHRVKVNTFLYCSPTTPHWQTRARWKETPFYAILETL